MSQIVELTTEEMDAIAGGAWYNSGNISGGLGAGTAFGVEAGLGSVGVDPFSAGFVGGYSGEAVRRGSAFISDTGNGAGS